MLTLQNFSYRHPNKDLLFDNINLTVNNYDKVALIGNNGSGKSTLLKIIAGELQFSEGQLNIERKPFYVPQLFGQFNHLRIAQALRIEKKLTALRDILKGDVEQENFQSLEDDWGIEERCTAALQHWKLKDLDLSQKMDSLSGGQRTKVFLAGISIHEAEFVLLDEPSNHLDGAGRQLLYDFIQSTRSTLLVVSHDRKLLSLLDKVYELDKRGITVYGGNYDFYVEQKRIEGNALNQELQSKEKALRQAKIKERETLERQQKLDARGKKKQEKAGMPRIMMNTLKNNAEKTSSKLKGVHAEKIEGISQEVLELRSTLPDIDKMRFGFDNSGLHKGKILFKATNVNYSYNNLRLWKQDLTFQINSGERIALKGLNGSGKTTLIGIIIGRLVPHSGTVFNAGNNSAYIDQDYSIIDNRRSVYEEAQRFNNSGLQEHEVKIRLNRFLFSKEEWDKSCGLLSGGEKMRLILCCLTIGTQSPDIIVLDEPTNNLDIQNIEILTAAVNEYEGTLIVVSHDEIFLDQVKVERVIQL